MVIASGYHVVITHGNGPQVGARLLRSELASDQVPAQTLDVCGVASQGEIGHLLSRVVRCRIEGTGGERGNANRGAER
jgi:carbamate kinase